MLLLHAWDSTEPPELLVDECLFFLQLLDLLHQILVLLGVGLLLLVVVLTRWILGSLFILLILQPLPVSQVLTGLLGVRFFAIIIALKRKVGCSALIKSALQLLALLND